MRAESPCTSSTPKITSPLLHVPNRSLAEALGTRSFWDAVLERDRSREAFAALLENGEIRRLVGQLTGLTYTLPTPVERRIIGSFKRPRTVYSFPALDSLLLKGVNSYLQAEGRLPISSACHSYQRGRGVMTTYKALMGDPLLSEKHCLRADVSDYFNNIDTKRLAEWLPPAISGDPALRHLFSQLLLGDEVLRGGELVVVANRGALPGTVLATMLSNLFLADVDESFRSAGITYVRYADDIVLFDEEAKIHGHLRRLTEMLEDRGLRLNMKKTKVFAPGEPWDFLGLTYRKGNLDVSPENIRMLRRDVTAVARAAAREGKRAGRSPEAIAAAMISTLNRVLYGDGRRSTRFTWTAYFFPLLSTAATLHEVDRMIQSRIRWAATGTHSLKTHRGLPYPALREFGYLPLAAAFQASRRGPDAYGRLLLSRVRGGPLAGAGVQRSLGSHPTM